MLALRIVFSFCLVLVLPSGVYIFRIRKRLFDRDPEVAAEHWAARNLRLWQVILVWLLAVDLLVTMLWRLSREEWPRTFRLSFPYGERHWGKFLCCDTLGTISGFQSPLAADAVVLYL